MMTTQTRHINPYIVGRPIYDQESFFGRRKLFRFIEDNLKQNTQVVLLHGQRRIGKSSVLMQIPNFVGLGEFVFIYFDLHDKTRLPLDSILQNLASTIADKLNIPQSESLSLNYKTVFSDEFLPQVIEVLKEQKRKMVWLLDEFDVLNDQTPDSPVESFFPYLETLIGQYNNLFIIPVVGRRVEDLTNLKSLFRQAVNQEIGLLEKSDAKALITEPAAHYLNYDSQAIDAILELSSGHPYFTQVICNALFLQAEEEDKSEITCDDVTKIVDDAIETAEGGLAWFRDGLPIPERVVFSAVAQAEKMAEKKNNSVTEEPLKLLREYGVIITEALNKAPENLVQWEFLERVENSEFHYKIKVKLVRYWLVKRYPLRQAIWDLEKVDLDACRLFELAEDIAENRNLSSSDIYEQITKLNPNHFTALFKLAEDYLDTKNYQQALEKYNRAYKVDPTRAYEGYELTRKEKYKIWWNKNRLTLALLSVFLLTISVSMNLFQLFQVQTQLKEKKARLDELEKLKEENVRLAKQVRVFAPTPIQSKSTNATILGNPGKTNIRSGPGLEYAPRHIAYPGDRVQVIESARNSDNLPWYKIYFPQSGADGWIAGNLLSIDPINAKVSGTPGTKNLRSGAGTFYGVVGTVRTGERMQILGSSYDKNGYQWYKVYHPQSGKTGWIAADQLISSD